MLILNPPPATLVQMNIGSKSPKGIYIKYISISCSIFRTVLERFCVGGIGVSVVLSVNKIGSYFYTKLDLSAKL